MVRNRRRTRLARLAAAGAAALLAVGIAACRGASTPAGGGASPSPSASAPVVPGGSVRFALPAGARPNYIWPYTPRANSTQYNAEGFQMLLYRPLYMFGDDATSVAVNYPLSVSKAPVYSDDGKTVTITMKGWKWS